MQVKEGLLAASCRLSALPDCRVAGITVFDTTRNMELSLVLRSFRHSKRRCQGDPNGRRGEARTGHRIGCHVGRFGGGRRVSGRDSGEGRRYGFREDGCEDVGIGFCGGGREGATYGRSDGYGNGARGGYPGGSTVLAEKSGARPDRHAVEVAVRMADRAAVRFARNQLPPVSEDGLKRFWEGHFEDVRSAPALLHSAF